jgi:O-antigen/teichoic acid export membrane protein
VPLGREARASEASATQHSRASLTVASGLLGLSTVATRLTTLVVMALLVRGAGPEAVGYFGLATLIASLTAAALSLGLPTYLTRQAPAGLVSPAEVARIHWTRVTVLLLVAGAALPVAGVVLPPAIWFGFGLFFVASLLEQGNETAWVLIRGTRSAWAEPLTNTSAGLLLVGACAADAWITGGLSFTHAAVYVASAAVVRSLVSFAVVGIRRHLRASGRLRVGRHVRAALPYFAADVLGLFYLRGDVILLALFVAAAEVGRYVSAAALIGPAVQVAASMGIGALAYAAPRFLSGIGPEGGAGPRDVDDPRTIVRFFTVSGQAVAGLMFLALPVAVTVLFGGAGDDILALAMVLGLFLALRFTNFGLSAILLARGRADRRLAVLVISIAGNVALNLALDPRFGTFGAAWATVATEVIVAASLLWSIRGPGLTRPVVWAFAVVAAAGAAMVVLTRAADQHATGAFAAGAVLLAVALASALVRRRGSRPVPDADSSAGAA